MAGFDYQDLAKWSGGAWSNRPPEGPILGFSFDTRILRPGDMFVAIETDKRDGHGFLEDALKKGASAALVQRVDDACPLPQLRVGDSARGFADIAQGRRGEFEATVIGVTGSCGKTTFKDLLIHLLGGAPDACGTQGNLNNLLGVPATILGIPSSGCQFAVIEAGISEKGEMERLANVIAPNLVVFTSIGPAHLEGLGSLEGIADEKGKLAAGPSVERVYLGGSCSPFVDRLAHGRDHVVLEEGNALRGGNGSYGWSENGGRMDVSLAACESVFRLRGSGSGLACNAALALSVALDLGATVAELKTRAESWKPSRMRGEWRRIGSANVYLDCYNANPQSMLEALGAFQRLSSASSGRLFIVGSMEELGSSSADWHRKVGAAMTLNQGDRAILLGAGAVHLARGLADAGFENNVSVIDRVEELKPVLRGFCGDVFIKGSRKYGLESAARFMDESKRKEEVC